MNTMTNDEWLKLLSTLTDDQKELVRAYVRRYPPGTPINDQAMQLILGIVNKELGTRIPFSSLKITWITHASNMAYFVDETFPNVKRKAAHYALYKMIIGLVIDDLRNCKIPVAYKSIFEHLERAPELFEAQFPGYRQSGLCGIILKAMGV